MGDIPDQSATLDPAFLLADGEAMKGTQVLTQGGFKPLSREEREEAARIAVEASFSFDGYGSLWYECR